MEQAVLKLEDDLMEKFFSVLDEKKIKTVFQPIVSLRDGSIYGYEALTKGRKTRSSIIRAYFSSLRKNTACYGTGTALPHQGDRDGPQP
jgi:EAL domain-containing protein (putative c-di-GMP-specific phosphodiesterase class I)